MKIVRSYILNRNSSYAAGPIHNRAARTRSQLDLGRCGQSSNLPRGEHVLPNISALSRVYSPIGLGLQVLTNPLAAMMEPT